MSRVDRYSVWRSNSMPFNGIRAYRISATRARGELAMMRRIAVVGDQLNTGGQIEPYTGPRFTWGDSGRQIALIGGAAYCEACKTIGTISKSGGQRRINFMGEAALDGDIVLCNCTEPARIVAKLAGDSWCDDMDYPATTSRVGTPSSSTERARDTYDEQFTLRDGNGRLLQDTYYTLRLANGALLHGSTDNEGRTARHVTDGTQNVRLYIGHRESA